MRLELIIPALLSALTTCLASPWLPESYPNPKLNPARCGTGSSIDGETVWFCDPDMVLATDTAAVINTVKDVSLNADCVCNCSTSPTNNGYKVGVAVAEAITNQNTVDPTASLDAFSQTVRENWFQTTSACDDKVLILLVRNVSQIHIALGSKITDILPSETQNSIDRDIEPFLQGSQYKDALELVLSELDLAINQNVAVLATATESTGMTTDEPEPEPNNLVWGILGVIAIMSILIFHYWIKY